MLVVLGSVQNWRFCFFRETWKLNILGRVCPKLAIWDKNTRVGLHMTACSICNECSKMYMVLFRLTRLYVTARTDDTRRDAGVYQKRLFGKRRSIIMRVWCKLHLPRTIAIRYSACVCTTWSTSISGRVANVVSTMNGNVLAVLASPGRWHVWECPIRLRISWAAHSIWCAIV